MWYHAGYHSGHLGLNPVRNSGKWCKHMLQNDPRELGHLNSNSPESLVEGSLEKLNSLAFWCATHGQRLLEKKSWRQETRILAFGHHLSMVSHPLGTGRAQPWSATAALLSRSGDDGAKQVS